ncbi:DNA polymerase III subunit delta [Methylocella sp.]|uniref:DNA polymerase III subunit delta n=1 Tax=Methylocella sp. TaxID=1978226 RepID=UPI0037849174
MVAISSREADRFLERPAPHIFLYLFYGTDAGLVSERARALVEKSVDDPKDPFQLLRLGGDDLASDPLRLADEVNTVGLFGGRRAVRVEGGGKAVAAALEPLFAAPPQGATVVVEAGALKNDSLLLRLAQREKAAAAIACAQDSREDVEALIEREAAAAGLTIARDAKILLASLLGEDRLSTRGELEKLMLYAHDAGEIVLDHVEAVVADASNLMLEHAVDAAFDGDFAGLDLESRRLAAQGVDANQLLGAALRHGLALRRATLSGHGAQGGWSRGGRGFERHLRAWSGDRLARAVDVLAEAVWRARLDQRLAPSITARALWSVAQAARRRG